MHRFPVAHLALLSLLALAAPALAAESSTPASPAAPPAAVSEPAFTTGRPPLTGAGRVLQTFGSDLLFVVTSPARMNWHDAAWLAGSLGVTAVVYANDEAILRAAGRNQDAALYVPVKRMGYNLEDLGLMNRTIPYYAGTIVLGYALNQREMMLIPAELIESHFIAGGVRNLSKLFIGRRRPFEHQGPDQFEFDGGTSFPSGHASVVFEAATILSEHAHFWPVSVVSYGLATTVALQRIDSGNHWASDVLVPAVTGTFIARAIVRRHREPAEESATQVGVISTPGGRVGFGVSTRF